MEVSTNFGRIIVVEPGDEKEVHPVENRGIVTFLSLRYAYKVLGPIRFQWREAKYVGAQ